ncbi:MAG: hypothetical protein HQ528_02845 [Candidatus Marinimicrobia bacterium]|nr:hypothetical protein [Candidatus Neomarinimicrobiota bacterium]
MRRLLPLILLLTVSQAQLLKLNRATFDEIAGLPITIEQAELLYDYVVYQGPVTTVYQLTEIPGFDSQLLEVLKPLVSLELPELTRFGSRLQDSYRKVEDWTSEEGANEGLIEVWLDRLAEPLNVNDATYDDLMALQNVSPVDAVAVIKRQQEGSIDYPRALRGAIGLSYYGYRNMADFFLYGEDESRKGYHFWYNTTYKTVPSTMSFDSEVGAVEPLGEHPGDLQHKLAASFGKHWKFGLSYHRHMGETDRALKLANTKSALIYRNFSLGQVKFDRIILGNFSATMGQGVVFESTDFFSPRRSGYGWSRRVVGVFSDLSKSYEYALQGAAVQGSVGNLQAFGFISTRERDAVLNADSTISTMITLYPRTNYGYNDLDNDGKRDLLTNPLLDVVTEVTYGGNFRYTFKPGMILGLSTYESLYDKVIDPQVQRTVISAADEGKFLTSIGNTADTEIAAMYASEAESPIWSDAKALRRVFGLDFTAVIKNLALQGEYGILDKDGIIGQFSNDPRALVLSAYLQFNSLNFLVVYRDYDLDYDNPYQRSFSNYQRYKGTIFEDTFYLEDAIYGFLYTGAAQPQAERGVYVYSRYQFHRQFVLTSDFDTWTRVADNARYLRTVVRLQYRPAFNYRFNIRQKWQMRGAHNKLDPSAFYARETIVRAQLRLSRYDNIELLYIQSFVDFTNRRRLSIDPLSGTAPAIVGSAGTGSEGLGFRMNHNFTDRMKIMGQVLMYNGFIWNFEDTDFQVFDSGGSDALRWWVAIFSRLGDNWAIRVKWTTDSGQLVTNYAFPKADAEANIRTLNNGLATRTESSDIRIQVDYAF